MPLRIDDLPSNSPTRTVEIVAPGSPAAEVGLQAGDEIIEIDGTAVTADQIPELLMRTSSGVTLTVRRGEKNVRLAAATPRIERGVRHLGFTLRSGGTTPVVMRGTIPEPLTSRLRRFLGAGGTIAGVRG